MPAPGTASTCHPQTELEIRDLFLAAKRVQHPDLAIEIAQLRREIAALRAELHPAPSLLVIGREAIEAFVRLPLTR